MMDRIYVPRSPASAIHSPRRLVLVHSSESLDEALAERPSHGMTYFLDGN